MGNSQKCPQCGNKKSWSIRRGKRRCSACRYEWRANRLPLHLSRAEWKRLLRWFLLGQSSARVAEEAHHIAPVFEGIVEIDETYLGGRWRNKRKDVRAKGAKRGRGTTKQAVFGILCRNG